MKCLDAPMVVYFRYMSLVGDFDLLMQRLCSRPHFIKSFHRDCKIIRRPPRIFVAVEKTTERHWPSGVCDALGSKQAIVKAFKPREHLLFGITHSISRPTFEHDDRAAMGDKFFGATKNAKLCPFDIDLDDIGGVDQTIQPTFYDPNLAFISPPAL